ncbi:hypothetical protein [Caballeronia novacaledonica]|uniref:Uncharacterized protein n=1 Tax=Caballeronia novacaledonica TaxID=1544861 RepID=A0AA37IIL3_9BURK|nr:hypothetical protein [Caballeronia novacaledonica]GJH29932.1 hypothetical protein CBA19CS42_35470 [Caballeronia novacaledonica]
MTLACPPYFDATLRQLAVLYPWDDWDVKRAYRPADPAVHATLTPLPRRAQIGMTIAIGEWIVCRLDKVDPDSDPKDYIEAAWCGNIHTVYCPYVEFDDDDWRGPVRRPLQLVMAIINDAFYFEGVDPAENAAWMFRLAEHVLPRTDSLVAWRDAVVPRLARYFPTPVVDEFDFSYDWQESEPLVPREWFNPAFDAPSWDADVLARRFLAGVDFLDNPFARTPDEIRAAGLTGILMP